MCLPLFACRFVQYVKERCQYLIDVEEKRRLELQVRPIPLSLGIYIDYKL
jgi:hypothetical protein